MRFPNKVGHGVWYKLTHDPDGHSNFYGFVPSKAVRQRCKCHNWLPGTRFRKYKNKKFAGEFVVTDELDLVRVE